MTELSDEEVFGRPRELSDAEVFGGRPEAPTYGDASDSIPEAFLDRVRAGQALSRILSAAGHEAQEGMTGQTPTGYSDDRLAHMIDIGVFHDPLKSRPGPIQMMNEAVLFPVAQAWQGLTTAINAGIHGAGGAAGQLVEEFGGSQGTASRAKNEIINAGNWALIEGGMGRFSRPSIVKDAQAIDAARGPVERVMDQTVGGLPRPEDFTNAGKVLDSPHAETNLKRMWQEDGITPAEAVHDAQSDAFLKHDITNGRPAFEPSYAPPDPLDLAMSGRLSVEAAESAAEGIKQYYKDVEKHIFGDRAEEWAKLNRQADRASVNMNDSLSRELREKQSKLEDEVGLSPADEDLLGGAGKPDTYDPEFWKGLKEDLHEIELGRDEALATVAHQVRYLPKSRDWDAMTNSERQSTLVIFSALNVERAAGRDPMSFLKEAFRQRAARYGGGADAAEIVEAQMKELRDLMDGAIERSGVAAPDLRALPAPKALPTPEDIEVLTETGGKPNSLGAAANTEPPMVPLTVQPASPPGSLAASFRSAADTLFDIGRDAQMLVAPMARGTKDSMAIAKDFANLLRRNRWDWSRIDTDIGKRFTPEQQARMFMAMDEESTSIRLGEPASMREHQGLATLEPAERAMVEDLDARQQNSWLRAIDAGIVEGEGIPMHAPRMVMNIAHASSKEGALSLDAIGRNLTVKTRNLRQRKYMTIEETEAAAKAKYGDEAVVARNIRTVALSTAELDDAIAGRTLINNIKKYGESTGADTVVEGAIPAGSETKWFTLDHPAFRTWRPQLREIEGKVQAVKDAEGNVVFEQVPLYVHGDFEGPLRAVLSQKSGALYGGMMSLKGKTMSLIMNSPMIHNAVEWGRALPAMPGKVATFKVYFEGNRAKNNPAIMGEAIDNGLVPIGHRFFNQDITSMMESPDLTPGRSWTAKLLAAVPGLFDEAAGVAVKRAIDKAGDFWHNTLLWDRVADLQMGLYTNLRADAIAKGIDPQTSSRLAAHWANRYAGALPKEAMSDAATKVSNMLLFSRSFTMGNLGVLKDMLTGLPKDVIAQIERDAGFKSGAINEAGELAGPAEDAVKYAKSLARRKAMAVVVADMALLYIGNSLMQNAFNVLVGDSTLDKELHGYAQRFQARMQAVKEHPLELIQPLRLLGDLSATSGNEPGKQERIHVGQASNGTAIYMRQPAGKIGEEFAGYMTGPLDMMRKKLGTVARPAWQIMSNDAGFGRKVYDPDADTPAKYLANLGRIAAHLAKSQFPEGQISAASDLVKGEGDAKVNALQALGPFAGVTFSKGAPGGPAVGEMYASRAQHEFAVNQALPDIRRQIQRGDEEGARDRMDALNIPPSLQRFYIKTTLDPALRMSPRATRDFYLHSTPEQRSRFERALQAPQP